MGLATLLYLYSHICYRWKYVCVQTFYMSDGCLYVYMNVSHRSKNKWEIAQFSGKILRIQGSRDHCEITWTQKVFFKARKWEGKWWKNASFYSTYICTGGQWGLIGRTLMQCIIIIIIIIKICSAHTSTLLGAQGAKTEKTWIQTIYSDSKNKIMYRDRCTMQLQIIIYIIFENCDIRWVLSSDLNLVILWQDLSFVGRWFQSLGAATEKYLSPQVRFEVGSFVPCCWSANCVKECRP